MMWSATRRIAYEGVICQEIQRIRETWMITPWYVTGKTDRHDICLGKGWYAIR